MEELYPYVFWYNDFEKAWYAIHRDNYGNFFSGTDKKTGVLKSKDIDTLVKTICKNSDNEKSL